MLKIYNTLGRSKQEFIPLRPGEVRMYVCGMTIYDLCHVGHARFYDEVRKALGLGPVTIMGISCRSRKM